MHYDQSSQNVQLKVPLVPSGERWSTGSRENPHFFPK